MLREGVAQTLDRLTHARHQIRGVELVEAGIKKSVGRGRIGKAPLHEQARRQRRKCQLACQPPDQFCVNR